MRHLKFALILLIVVITLVIVFFSRNYIANTFFTSSVKDNPVHNTKIYNNDSLGFRLEFPEPYQLNEPLFSKGNEISLERNISYNKEGYALATGTEISINYKESVIQTTLNDYVDNENSEDVKEKKTINGLEVIIVDLDNKYPLKSPGIKLAYFRKNNDVLVVLLMAGEKTTEKELEQSIKDFEFVINSIFFSH